MPDSQQNGGLVTLTCHWFSHLKYSHRLSVTSLNLRSQDNQNDFEMNHIRSIPMFFIVSTAQETNKMN